MQEHLLLALTKISALDESVSLMKRQLAAMCTHLLPVFIGYKESLPPAPLPGGLVTIASRGYDDKMCYFSDSIEVSGLKFYVTAEFSNNGKFGIFLSLEDKECDSVLVKFDLGVAGDLDPFPCAWTTNCETCGGGLCRVPGHGTD